MNNIKLFSYHISTVIFDWRNEVMAINEEENMKEIIMKILMAENNRINN
jgi:hypothetical protein